MCLPTRRRSKLLFLLHGILIGLAIAFAVRCVLKKCRAVERAFSRSGCDPFTPDCEPDSDT